MIFHDFKDSRSLDFLCLYSFFFKPLLLVKKTADVLVCTLPVPLRALETNRYNHITATYFLLAERILREKQEKEIQTRSASPSNIKAQFR